MAIMMLGFWALVLWGMVALLRGQGGVGVRRTGAGDELCERPRAEAS